MDLAFTFGIITDGSPEATPRLHTILNSIASENIPHHQILIVGNAPGSFNQHPHTTVIPFDESPKNRWITRKKNLLTQDAQYENIVYLHDYLHLLPGWYAGFQAFGDDFQACMNPILNADNSRFRDWTLFYDASSTPARSHAGLHQLENLLPYSETSLSKLMYFSGAYFIAKKSLMQKLPLDERLSWGEGEDVAWSHHFREQHSFTINPNSKVKIVGKNKDPIFREIPLEKLAKLKSFLAQNPPEPGYACNDNIETWHAHGHFGPITNYKPQPLAAQTVPA